MPNAELKKVADEFQADVVRVMLERKEINEENEIIADKALEGTKKKKRPTSPTSLSPTTISAPAAGCGLKPMPEEDNNFYTEVFLRELRDSDDPKAMAAAGAPAAENGCACCSADGGSKAAWARSRKRKWRR